MAFGKVKEIKGLKIISIAGAAHGVGVTHLAITLANTLKNAGFKVAILEDNKSRNFNELQENLLLKNLGPGFEYQKVDYYFHQRERNIMEIKSEGYDYLVADCGLFKECDRGFFDMSNINIIVASCRYWNFGDLVLNVIKNPNVQNYDEYTYVFPFCSGNKLVQKDILDAIECSEVYFTEYNEDPFISSDSIEIRKLLDLEESTTTKKSLFSGFSKKKTIPKESSTTAYSVSEDDIDFEDFDEPDEEKLSIDDLRDIADEVIRESSGYIATNTRSTSAYRQPIQDPKVNAREQSMELKQAVKELLDTPELPTPAAQTNQSIPANSAEDTKPKPQPKKFLEEAKELNKSISFVNKALGFDVIKEAPKRKELELLLKEQIYIIGEILKNNA